MWRKLKDLFRPSTPKPSVRMVGPELSVPLQESLAPATLVSPACPSCGVIQEPPPKRKKKCKDCGQFIYVRTQWSNRKRYLMTEDQARNFDIEEGHLDSPLIPRDTKWKTRVSQALTAYKAGDFDTARTAHLQLALLLFREGRDHHRTAQTSRTDNLLYCQELGQRLGFEKK